MTLLRIFSTSLLAAAVLCGCASAPLPEATDLHPAARAATIELTEVLSWHTDGIPMDRGLAPGRYVAERENQLGTFYHGQPGSLFLLIHEHRDSFVMRKPQLMRMDGGLWVPRNGGPAQIYQVVNPDDALRAQTLDAGPKDVHAIFPPLPPQAPSGPSAADRAATDIALRQATLGTPGVGAGAGVVGGAVAGALVGAIIESERGRIVLIPAPKGGELEARMQKIADAARAPAADAKAQLHE